MLSPNLHIWVLIEKKLKKRNKRRELGKRIHKPGKKTHKFGKRTHKLGKRTLKLGKRILFLGKAHPNQVAAI